MLKRAIIATFAILAIASTAANAKTAAELDDLEIAHVAYTADLIDIRYAHLALAKSKDPAVHRFAMTMIRDHSAVNEKALALVAKLEASPKVNFLSSALDKEADALVTEMSRLSGHAFDIRYAENELRYHKAVNALVADTFIPNIEHPEVKALFEEALVIFTVHERHAERMVDALKGKSNMGN